jgi:hypothetical protein
MSYNRNSDEALGKNLTVNSDAQRPVEPVVMCDSALNWKVRFETIDGLYTFTNISKKGGFKIDREEVEEWAEAQVRINDSYDRVDAIINIDSDT